MCILWVFLEPYFSCDYLGISYHSLICKNVKLFSVELWPVIFEIKNEKNSSSFFFSVKILSKDSILDSHRSHDYITFLVVRGIFTILRDQHSLECTSFHTFSEKKSVKMKLRTIEFRSNWDRYPNWKWHFNDLMWSEDKMDWCVPIRIVGRVVLSLELYFTRSLTPFVHFQFNYPCNQCATKCNQLHLLSISFNQHQSDAV